MQGSKMDCLQKKEIILQIAKLLIKIKTKQWNPFFHSNSVAIGGSKMVKQSVYGDFRQSNNLFDSSKKSEDLAS